MLKQLIILLITVIAFAYADLSNKFTKRNVPLTVNGWDPNKIPYPSVKRDNVSFEYSSAKAKGKVTVADPYNWLEAPLNTTEIQNFIKQQTTLTDSFLKGCKDKDAIRQAIETASDYVYYDQFVEFGKPIPSYLFAAQALNQSLKWYLATETDLKSAKEDNFTHIPGRLILDEATLSRDGSLYVGKWQITNNRKLAMFNVFGGENGSEIRFMDLTTLKIQKDILSSAGFMSFYFTPDEEGVVYDTQFIGDPNSSDPDPKRGSRILYHKIGSDPKTDIVIVKEDQKTNANVWYAEFTADEKYMNVYGLLDEKHYRLYVAPLDQPFSANMKWISLLPNYKASLQYVANFETEYYFLSTQAGANNGKIARGKIDPSKAQTVKDLRELKDTIKTQDVIPENKQGILENWGVLDKTKILLAYLENGRFKFYVYDFITGKRIQQIFSDFNGKLNAIGFANSKQVFLQFSSLTIATGIYRVRSDDGKITLQPTLIGNPAKIDMKEFKTEQHFAISKDGARVPFYIFYSANHPLDGTNPAWLFGFGSFGDNVIPSYDAYLLPWVRDYGGVAAYLQIRGGGELGEDWHKAGMLGQRQHSFDDFQAVAEYMVKNKLAAKGKIVAEGKNAGGTVAMVMGNQAPEGLFGALLPNVALLDMLRYDKYPDAEEYVPEWGSPQKPKEFDVLRAYSPLHNIDAKKTYPSTLLISILDDVRNSPIHSFKMIAELQHTRPKNINPLLMHIVDDTDPSAYALDTNVITQCFVNQVLGLEKGK